MGTNWYDGIPFPNFTPSILTEGIRLSNKSNILFQIFRERYGVDITPLSYIPGGRIDRYLGNLNFFFIRESTSIREVCIYIYIFQVIVLYCHGLPGKLMTTFDFVIGVTQSLLFKLICSKQLQLV